MDRLSRALLGAIDPDEVQVLHAVQRYVRRAFLCGEAMNDFHVRVC